MFAKKSFNPSTIRVFSFILAGIVLIGINVLLSGFAMNKVYRYTENQFLENYSLNSDGYAKSVEQILSKYISLLDYFDSDYISSSSEKDIQNYLVSLYKKIPKDVILHYEKNANKNCDFEYNVKISLEEQNVSKTAKTMIAILFRDYWATGLQREKIITKQKSDRMKLEEEKRAKYNTDIFQNL